MFSALGKELRKFPLYESSVYEKEGHMSVMEGGIVLDFNGSVIDISHLMIEDVRVLEVLPSAKCHVGLKYCNYMGSTVDLRMVMSEEDYRFLSSAIKK